MLWLRPIDDNPLAVNQAFLAEAFAGSTELSSLPAVPFPELRDSLALAIEPN